MEKTIKQDKSYNSMTKKDLIDTLKNLNVEFNKQKEKLSKTDKEIKKLTSLNEEEIKEKNCYKSRLGSKIKEIEEKNKLINNLKLRKRILNKENRELKEFELEIRKYSNLCVSEFVNSEEDKQHTEFHYNNDLELTSHKILFIVRKYLENKGKTEVLLERKITTSELIDKL